MSRTSNISNLTPRQFNHFSSPSSKIVVSGGSRQGVRITPSYGLTAKKRKEPENNPDWLKVAKEMNLGTRQIEIELRPTLKPSVKLSEDNIKILRNSVFDLLANPFDKEAQENFICLIKQINPEIEKSARKVISVTQKSELVFTLSIASFLSCSEGLNLSLPEVVKIMRLDNSPTIAEISKQEMNIIQECDLFKSNPKFAKIFNVLNGAGKNSIVAQIFSFPIILEYQWLKQDTEALNKVKQLFYGAFGKEELKGIGPGFFSDLQTIARRYYHEFPEI